MRLVLLPLLLVLGLAPLLQAADSGPSPWMPLREGQVWLYKLHRDRTVERSEGSERLYYLGRSREFVRPRNLSDPDGVYVVRTESREDPVGSVGEGEFREFEQRMSAQGQGMLLHGVEHFWSEPGRARRFVYDPPVQLLPPTTKPGTRWKVGTLRSPELDVTLQGAVVGIEDIEIDGRAYESCLHIHLSGSARSVALVGDPDAQRYERDLWLQRGVGVVKDVTELQLQLLGEEGEKFALSQVSTRELSRFEPGL